MVNGFINKYTFHFNVALKYRLRFHQPFIRRPLVEAYIKTKDAHSLVRIVASSG